MPHEVAETVVVPFPAQPSDSADGHAAEIADSMINLVRLYASIKSRMATTVDPEVVPLFLLVRLVREGPKRAKELAEEMCADPSTVSRQVASLVKSGLVERKADPDDGRASILVPTDLGVARVHEHYVTRGTAIEPVIADWSLADRGDFLRLLREYISALEARREEVIAAMARNQTLHHMPHARPERSN